MYKEHIDRILEKLDVLKRKDKSYSIFGSNEHRYQLSKTWTSREVSNFEQKWKVELPEDYKAFLLMAGSGGAGPYYGLERPEDGVYQDLDYKDELNQVSGLFAYTEAWNASLESDEDASEEEREAFEREYFHTERSAGLLRISNFGCGVTVNLVVNGQSYGEIWIDDRVNDGGIYPDHSFGNTVRLSFLTWYEAWLDTSLAAL